MKQLMLAVLLFVSAWGSFTHAEQSDVFTSPTAGFQVSKPVGWHYVTAAQNLENLKATKLSDQEFQAAMLKYATAPLVAMTKFPEPYEDLNPSFKVNIKPFGQLKGKAATDIIGLMLPQFQKAFKDFKLVQPPTEVEVSGIKSGYARINYSLQTPDGTVFPTTSELWIVPRGDYFFIVGAGTRQDEKTGSREEIANIVRSVKIEQ
jgi:hypothetical protein